MQRVRRGEEVREWVPLRGSHSLKPLTFSHLLYVLSPSFFWFGSFLALKWQKKATVGGFGAMVWRISGKFLSYLCTVIKTQKQVWHYLKSKKWKKKEVNLNYEWSPYFFKPSFLKETLKCFLQKTTTKSALFNPNI